MERRVLISRQKSIHLNEIFRHYELQVTSDVYLVYGYSIYLQTYFSSGTICLERHQMLWDSFIAVLVLQEACSAVRFLNQGHQEVPLSWLTDRKQYFRYTYTYMILLSF